MERCSKPANALPDIPLVFHGGSGTLLEDVRAVIENGIVKDEAHHLPERE